MSRPGRRPRVGAVGAVHFGAGEAPRGPAYRLGEGPATPGALLERDTRPSMRRNAMSSDDKVAIARAAYEAYVSKDRAAIEALLAEDFHFTSPLDNRLDRATYFERCWPNSVETSDFRFVHLVPHGDRVFVTYEVTTRNG